MADASPPDFAPPPAAPPANGAPPPPPPPAWAPPPSPPPSSPAPYGWAPYAWAPQAQASTVGSGRFRAMNLGELFDAVFSLYRRNFLLIAAISAIVEVPYAVLTFVLYQVLDFTGLQAQLQNAAQPLGNPGQTPTPEQIQSVFNAAGPILAISGLLVLISFFVVRPLAIAATTRAVSDRYLDRPASIGSSYAAALARLGALIVQSLILLLGFAAGIAAVVAVGVGLSAALGGGGIALTVVLLLAAVAFGVMVSVRTSLAPPAIVLERCSGWTGLVRSWNLVSGFFWRIFGIELLLGIITAVISGIVVFILTLAGLGLDAGGRFVLQEIAGAFAAVFVNPIIYIAYTLLYYDTRIRKEGFDIEMLAQSL